MLEFVAPNPAWTVVLVLNILDREATNVLAVNQDIKDPNVNLTGLYSSNEMRKTENKHLIIVC